MEQTRKERRKLHKCRAFIDSLPTDKKEPVIWMARMLGPEALNSRGSPFREEEIEKPKEPKSIFNESIKKLGVGARAENALRNRNINKIRDLVSKTENDLLHHTKNLGRKSLKEIKEALEDEGLSFGLEIAQPVRILELGPRLEEFFLKLGIITIEDLTIKTEEELSSCHTINAQDIGDIKGALARIGLRLGMRV